MNTFETALAVPQFDTAGLSSSSLILADVIDKIPARTIGGVMFAIGDMKVRPRLGNGFTNGETMGVYLQLYNFMPDLTTQKPSGSIEYLIEKDASSEKAIDFSEDVGVIANASANQVTIEKLLPLRTLEPGRYMLNVTATDRIANQTLRQRAYFTVGQP